MQALIFDFDGTILDTEHTELSAWQYMYTEYGLTLPLTEWQKRVSSDLGTFDPFVHLENLLGISLDQDSFNKRRREKLFELVADLQPLPGVLNWLLAAKDLGMKLAVASSSPRYWVEGHLKRIGFLNYFDLIVTREDVSNLKPHPEAYQLVLSHFNIESDVAMAIEDSPNGAYAALSAGLKCIAVPNSVTGNLSFPPVFLVTPNLEKITLNKALKLFL